MKFFKTLLVYLLIMSLVVMLSGCKLFGKDEIVDEDDDLDEYNDDANVDDDEDSSPTVSETREATLYYVNANGEVVAVLGRIAKAEGIGKEAVKALIDTQETRQALLPQGLFPSLPANTTFDLNIKQEEKLAIIDLSEDVLNYDTKAQEQAIVTSLVYTLTEFESVDKVQIWIGGKVLEQLPQGTRIDQPLSRSDVSRVSNTSSINLPAATANNSSPSFVILYYYITDPKGQTSFVEVKRELGSKKLDVKTAIEELIKGPEKNSGLSFDLPETAKLLSVNVKDGVAYIEFSEEILELEDPLKQQNVSKSIVYTLKQFKELKAVTLMADGQGLIFITMDQI